MYGGRWCDAYPLGIDLVREAVRHGPRYSMCPTTAVCGMGSRYRPYI